MHREIFERVYRPTLWMIIIILLKELLVMPTSPTFTKVLSLSGDLTEVVLTCLSGELGDQLWNGECILDREFSLEGHEASHHPVLPEANTNTTT